MTTLKNHELKSCLGNPKAPSSPMALGALDQTDQETYWEELHTGELA